MLSTCFVIGINNNSSSSSSSSACFSNYLCPLNVQLGPVQSKLLRFVLRMSCTFYWTQVRSLPCLVRHVVFMLNFAQIVEFEAVTWITVEIVKWISLSSYKDFSKLIHVFLYIDLFKVYTWISLMFKWIKGVE